LYTSPDPTNPTPLLEDFTTHASTQTWVGFYSPRSDNGLISFFSSPHIFSRIFVSTSQGAASRLQMATTVSFPAIKSHPAAYLLPSSGFQTSGLAQMSTMAYNYHGGPSHSIDSNVGDQAYFSHFAMDPHNSLPARYPNPSMSAEMGDPGAGLRRSMSFPNNGPLGLPPPDPASFANHGEKKRNKLGYHRTSIACSHCRKRKIRCIPLSDTQSACQNCVRLKKACSFLAADQHGSGDARPKISTRMPAGPKLGSSSGSSPVNSSSSIMENRIQHDSAASSTAPYGITTPSMISHARAQPIDGAEDHTRGRASWGHQAIQNEAC
jgi:hypothetical protein